MRESFGLVNVVTGEDTKNPRLKVELTIPSLRARLMLADAIKLRDDLTKAIDSAQEHTNDAKEQFRQSMIRWLQSQDRNGCFSDEDSVAEGGRPMTVEQGIEIATTWAVDQVEGDIRNGTVPADVTTFAQLHDHVDANYYGGALAWGPPKDETVREFWMTFWDKVQNNVHEWLQAGRLAGLHKMFDGMTLPDGVRVNFGCTGLPIEVSLAPGQHRSFVSVSAALKFISDNANAQP